MFNKKLKISFLLSLYLFGVLQFLAPYVEYYVNFDFIVKNLCKQKDNPENFCMGHCYLNKQLLKKLTEQEDKPQKSEKEFNFQFLSFHFVNNNTELKSTEPDSKKYFHQNSLSYESLIPEPIIPPPKFC